MTSYRKAADFQRGLAIGVLSLSSLFAQPSVLGVYNDAGIPLVDYPPEAIAPGSVFAVYGLNIGSPILEKAGYPLPTNLASTSIQVSADGKTLDAFIISTSEKKIRAVLPSTTPLGDAQLIINYDGMLSPQDELLQQCQSRDLWLRKCLLKPIRFAGRRMEEGTSRRGL